MEYAVSQHTLHVDVARDGRVEDGEEVSVLVNEDIVVFIASTGRHFD